MPFASHVVIESQISRRPRLTFDLLMTNCVSLFIVFSATSTLLAVGGARADTASP